MGFSSVVKKGDAKKIEKIYNLPSKISAPIQLGDEVGYIEYRLNDQIIGKSSIVSTENVKKIDFMTLFIRILSKFLIK